MCWINLLVCALCSGVNMSDIVGMRAPFLAVGGDTMYQMLWENGFLYDSSIPSSQTNPPLWPYTLDSPLPHKCFQEPCPKGYWPGLWEVPMTYFVGWGAGLALSGVSQCHSTAIHRMISTTITAPKQEQLLTNQRNQFSNLFLRKNFLRFMKSFCRRIISSSLFFGMIWSDLLLLDICEIWIPVFCFESRKKCEI